MMKAETMLPLDLEINQTRREQIWLTKGQLEVLEIVALALDQTLSEYITETILSMLECDVEETVPNKLKERFSREAVEVSQS
ncbi:MAG: hypothetical protein ACR2IS_08440 [Nitrososphaeraceae archaeon]